MLPDQEAPRSWSPTCPIFVIVASSGAAVPRVAAFPDLHPRSSRVIVALGNSVVEYRFKTKRVSRRLDAQAASRRSFKYTAQPDRETG